MYVFCVNVLVYLYKAITPYAATDRAINCEINLSEVKVCMAIGVACIHVCLIVIMYKEM